MTVIKRLELTAFGKFINKTVTFECGLTEFIYENEWGKSTLCDFILFMLYGVKASSNKKFTLDQKHLEKYMPWSGDGYIAGAMELTHGGDDYRVERRVTEKGTARINVYKNGSDCSMREPGEEFFGVDKDTFMRTFLVRQTDIRFDRTADCESALRNLVTTGDEDVSFDKAMKKLDSLQTPIQSQKQRNTGKIPQLRREISSLELEATSLLYNKEVLDRRLCDLQSLSASLDSARAEALELDKKQQAARGNDAKALLSRLEAVDRDIRECEGRISSAGQPLSEIEKNYMSGMFTECALLQKQLEDDSACLSRVRDEMSVKRREFADYELFESDETQIKELMSSTPRPNAPVALVGALIAVVGAVLGLVLMPYLWAVAAVGAVIALLGLAVIKTPVKIPAEYALSQEELKEKYSRFSDVREAVQKLDIERELYDKKTADGAAKKARAEAAVRKIKQDYGIDSQDGLNARLSAEKNTEETVSTVKKLREQRVLLLGDRDENELYKIAVLADGSDLTVARLTQLKMETSDRIAELTSQISALEAARIERADIERSIITLTENKKNTERTLSELEYKNDVYSYVRDALSRANEKIKGTYSPILSKRIAPVLSELTDGKYTDATVDKEFNIRIKAEGEYHELGYFSRGTADAVYFAVRLCMADILSESAPLILDDPFWSFDSDRLKNANNIINKISESRQVILFGAR